MKYCKYCGTQLEDDAVFCVNCGAKQVENQTSTENATQNENNNANYFNNMQSGNSNNYYDNRSDDAPSVGFGILGFFFPLIGLILYLVWKDTYPLKAKSCGKGALIGFIFSIVSGIISGCAMTLFAMSIAENYYLIPLFLL
ncbi:MAG: zinc ribbon domain-containing protein [Clostridia bacterium]|nr:zinc ribbon domain-containing protein [Clostridia bacterium]